MHPCLSEGADVQDLEEGSESEFSDADLVTEQQDSLRKQAGLPTLPEDGLPSSSAQKMM